MQKAEFIDSTEKIKELNYRVTNLYYSGAIPKERD